MTHSTQYLYNCKPTEFMNLPYHEALKYKIQKCSNLMEVLRVEIRSLKYDSKEHSEKLSHYLLVEKAKLFNESLLEELSDE